MTQDRQDKLAIYKVILRTYWSRARFPRHYPEWRPPAQFGKLIVHDRKGFRSYAGFVDKQRGVEGARGEEDDKKYSNGDWEEEKENSLDEVASRNLVKYDNFP
ncbi:hypothetical protein PV325_006798 [Microctonus aethiopoides]|nr:hypothetical protein PV325_006798 [Microctonus aethiopoides]